MMLSETSKNKLLSFLAIYWALFLGACFFTFPSWDDYTYANWYFEKGFFDLQEFLYTGWGGRFISTALLSLCPMTWRWDSGYQVWSLLMYLLFTFSVWSLVQAFFEHWSSKDKVLWTLAGTSLYTVGTPSLVQAYYWMTGYLTYTVCLVFVAWGIVCIKGLMERFSWGKFIGLLVCIVFICGSNEISMFLWNLFLLAFIGARLLSGKKVPHWLAVAFAFSIIVGLIEILAPGNFERTTHFEKAGRPFRTLGNSILHYFIFSVKLLTAPLVVLIIAYHEKWTAWAGQFTKSIEEKKVKWLIFSFWFLLFFVTTGMAFWAMGRKPNSRSLNVVIYFYYLSLPFALSLIGLWLKEKSSVRWSKLQMVVKKHFVIIFITAFVFSPHTLNVIYDYAKNFIPYRQQWHDRISTLQEGEGKQLVLPRLQNRPKTTFFHEFHPKPVYVEKYYKLEQLKLIDE